MARKVLLGNDNQLQRKSKKKKKLEEFSQIAANNITRGQVPIPADPLVDVVRKEGVVGGMILQPYSFPRLDVNSCGRSYKCEVRQSGSLEI